MSEELIWPHGSVDSRQNGWMETDGKKQADGPTRDSDTLTREQVEGYFESTENNPQKPFCISTAECIATMQQKIFK